MVKVVWTQNVNPRQKFPSIIFVVIIIVLGIYCLIAVIHYETRTTSLIKTKLGKVSGITVNRLGKSVNCYFGIPYAEPPVGKLRFKKPKPKKPWIGLLNASKPPPQCMQTSTSSIPMYKPYIIPIMKLVENIPYLNLYLNPGISEDCLYLNIFMESNLSSKSNRTVMVFIHGGAFVLGSISLALYDGSTLAAFGDVIVVTINYRLGIFGFLSSNLSESEGNFGLHDQVLALKWIQNNINAFGGNPNNVVLFGESAGAISIGYHLISPLSKNLFKRAILQSGSAINLVNLRGKALSNMVTIELIKSFSCPLKIRNHLNSTQEISGSSLMCLRNVNASDLLELQNQFFNKSLTFFPSEDEGFFGGDPFTLVKDHKFNTNTEIIIGSNSDEYALFAQSGPLAKFWSMDAISPNFTKANVMKIVENSYSESFQSFLQTITDILIEENDDENDYVNNWNRIIKIFGDIMFTCPNYVFINSYSSFGGKVYYYRFEARPSIADWSPKWVKGAVHSDEIIYIFGFPLIAQNMFKPEEIELSKSMIRAWTQFANNGIAKFGNNSWLQYEEKKPHYMSINSGNISLIEGFPGLKCDLYFEYLYNEVRILANDKQFFNKIKLELKI